MLVLTRREGESIIIDGNVRVVVVRMHGNWVRIGIDAPGGMSVHREEIQRKVDEEGLQSC